MTDQKKPVLDQQSFEKLLEAAYVMQEHNRKMRELEESLESQSEQLREQELAHQAQLQRTKTTPEEPSPANVDYTLTLAQIVEAQHQIQIRHLELDQALAVVAERVARIANARGSAIGILEGNSVRYRAGAGSSALPVGSEIPLRSAVCQANIRTGQVIRSEDVNIEILFDPEPCLKRGILSLVAVPIYHDGDIVGSLELYFDRVRGFAEQDIHTCQLMAGLVTEAIGRDAQSKLKQTMATERSTMLAAHERLKPELAAVAEDEAAAVTSGHRVNGSRAPSETFACWKCGNALLAEEQFCGKCGVSRAGDEAAFSMQGNIASALRTQQTSQRTSAAASETETAETSTWGAAYAHSDGADFSKADVADIHAELFSASELEENFPPDFVTPPGAENRSISPDEPADENSANVGSTGLVALPENAMWTSAAKARDFLESVSGTRTPGALARFWRSRRGDFYLAVALILVAVVIRWGIWSDHSVGVTAHGNALSKNTSRRKQTPEANLSAFDKLLIALGLAEPPDDAPEYKGNPDTQVWVDLQTALYYCPGSDLYGKSPKGKLSSQRDAQLDQFEPAYRKACD